MQRCDNAVVGEKLTRYESSVRGCIGRLGATDLPRSTVQVVFAECPPTDGEEHCSLGMLSGDVPCSQAQRTHSRTAIG
jgi:hypothetical protein